jgi:hypothetical protein
MATESSEPRVGLIFKVGIFCIGLLVATRAALNTYFDFMEQAEVARKIGTAKPEALLNLRASESARLGGGAMPIDKAMAQVASRGRMGMGPEFAPSNSKDIAPLQGWAKMPNDVPPEMTAPAPDVDGGALAAIPDAGRARSTDGGVKSRVQSREGGAP